VWPVVDVHDPTFGFDQSSPPEQLRAAYEAERGSDPDNWPHRHPGIVIDAVQFVAHAACLGCQWIDQLGTSMEEPGWREASATVARRHERKTTNAPSGGGGVGTKGRCDIR
jgi:hypothetical protein